MKVKEIMTTDLAMIHSTSSLREAAQKMKSLNVGVLPVREKMKLVGLLTDRDIVIRALAEGRDPASTQVREIISAQLISCSEEDSVETAASLMGEKKVRRLIVCDRDRIPSGILSLGDMAAKTNQNERVGAALESISEPSVPAS